MEKTKISRDETAYVAHLARLSFSEAETEKMTAQLNDILLYMDKLGQVETGEVAPLSHAIAQKNAFRGDEVAASLAPEDALANAPDPRGGFFQVPKVIE